MERPAHQITQLLQAWSEGDQGALDQLVPIVYEDLRRLAGYYMARERAADAKGASKAIVRRSVMIAAVGYLSSSSTPYSCRPRQSGLIRGIEGVALILDIDSQAARTGLRSGRSVIAIAGPHRSLRARARSCTMC